jgi:hypothetical protein
MKRVHQYDGPTTELSPTATSGQVPRKAVSRKRKASTEDSGEKRQKVAKITAEQQRQQAREQMAFHFLIKKQLLIDYVNDLGSPNDLRHDIEQDFKTLCDICTMYCKK